MLTISLYLSGQTDENLRSDVVIDETIESILANNPDISDAQINELIERLENLQIRGFDVNRDDWSLMIQLLLLDELQASEIRSHIEKYGNLIALYELQTIPSLSEADINRMLPFLQPIGIDSRNFFDWNMFYKGNQEVMVRYGRILQDQKGYKGDAPNYLGSPDRLSIRFKHTVPGRLSMGFGLEKDAGEPMDRKYNRLLFDFSTFHIAIEKVNPKINKIVLGDFQASAGQGLILFSGYGFGRSAFTTAVKRGERSLRQSTSLNEINALRGAGIDISISKNLSLVAFGSYRKSDGNAIIPDSIDNEQEELISSLQMTGLHRTLSEIEDKGLVNQLTAGASLKLVKGKFKGGLNTVYDQLDRSLTPSDRIYNRFYFKGKEALNSSVDYSWFVKNIVFFGETAVNKEMALATVNGALIGLHPKVSLALLVRHLPKEYYALHGRVFADQSTSTNETGFYIGTEIKPVPRLVINAYADYFRHSWPIFQASGPSEGSAYLIKFSFQKRKKWDSYLQLRYQTEQVDDLNNDIITGLFLRKKTDARLHFNKKVGKLMTWSSRLELSHLSLPGNVSENGYLMYQELWARPMGKPLSGFVRFALFNTDSYQSRIYTYEHYVAYDSRNVPFDGNGTRVVAGLRFKTFIGLTFEASYMRTAYNDRNTIGSGNDLIEGNQRSEIRAQIRYSLTD